MASEHFSTPWSHSTRVQTIPFSIQRFPLQNYRIIHLSDIHVGYMHLGKSYLDSLIDQVLTIEADICVITGDLILGEDGFDPKVLDSLRRLTKAIKTYFVLGNHEIGFYQHRIEDFLTKLRTLGLHTLFNESIIITKEGQRFNLVGLSDFIGVYYDASPDAKKAFSQIENNLATILLLHRPSWIKFVLHYPFNLVLSGHHHGGQLSKLGLLPVIIQHRPKYLYGKHQLGEDRFLYISNGIGYSRFPVRIFSPSEIALIVIN